jgi:precorrin isomerase
MWTDPIVADIHEIRASITSRAGDNSHALTLEAERLAKEAAEKYGMQWHSTAPSQRPAAVAKPE